MAALAWITGLVLTAAFLAGGGMKLMGTEVAIDAANKLGYANLRQAIGLAEIAGGLGVFIGIVSDKRNLEWLGFFAAIGLIILMVGAVDYHRRAGDSPKDWAPAIVMAVLAVLYLVAISQRS